MPLPVLACPVSLSTTVNAIKLETGLRPNSAGIPYTLLLDLGYWVSNFWASTVKVITFGIMEGL